MATRKPANEKRRYWLVYDLGLRGNYDVLYEWLDACGATECGDSVATFQSSRTIQQLQSDLTKLLGDTKARLYLISNADHRGGFILGKRKAAPWAGYSQAAVESVLDT